MQTLSGSTNLAGRLAQRVDSFGDTHYSYDEAGHVLSERRARLGTYTPGDGYLSPDTLYVWSRTETC